jgi:hypothetical protein
MMLKKKATTVLVLSHHYYMLAITAPMFVNEEGAFYHCIISVTLYMHNNKHGSYIVLIGVTDRAYPSMCTLSEQIFSDPSDSAILPKSSSFWGHGLATFLLSTIQVLSFLGYTVPVVSDPSEPFTLDCKKHALITAHHLYLQACLEIGSAYVTYLELGFTALAVGSGNLPLKIILQ